jgi:hypothetical protein
MEEEGGNHGWDLAPTGIRGCFVRDTCSKYTRGFFESAGGPARVDERPTLGWTHGAPATGDVETRPESFAVVMAIKT